MTFAARRLRNGAVALVLLAGTGGAVYLQHLALRDTSYLTGWILVAATVVLAGYNLRKKLPFLPLADSASWMQVHAWLGLVTVGVFLMHAGVDWPDGRLEGLLWLLYVGVLLSGVVGLAITRLVPRALTEHGERVIFERIPRYRAQLAREVEDLATRSLEDTASGTIASYYSRRLQPYFARPRHLLRHLCRSQAPLHRMRRELRSLDRYFGDKGRQTLDEIEARVLAKDNLDFQYAWQGLLKGWLFAHVPLTYAAIVVAAVHVVLAYAFGATTP